MNRKPIIPIMNNFKEITEMPVGTIMLTDEFYEKFTDPKSLRRMAIVPTYSIDPVSGEATLISFSMIHDGQVEKFGRSNHEPNN